jgi:hypothetical protein
VRRVSASCAHATSRAAACAIRSPAQRRRVDTGQNPPRRRVRGHRPEQPRLLAQHRQIRDRLTAISGQDRHVCRDPTRIMRRPALPQRAQRPAEAGD